MTLYKRVAVAFIAMVVIAIGAAGVGVAGERPPNVVGADEILARIDRQAGQADADRQAIRSMLQRPEIRQIAGSAGLDLERASAAAAVLSGPSLETLSAQARDVNASLSGGDTRIVVSATLVIIVLLILILLLN